MEQERPTLEDPLDYIERVLPEAESRDDFERIAEELRKINRWVHTLVLALLVEADDRDERVRLADWRAMFSEQLLKAHQVLVAYLKNVAPTIGLDDQAGL